MRHPPPRRVVLANPISTGNSSKSKRKEKDNSFKSLTTTPKAPIPTLFKPDKPSTDPKSSKRGSIPMLCDKDSSPELKHKNHLLAGYMAHEFLTKGTLLGKMHGRLPSPIPESQQDKNERYVKLTQLLNMPGGAELPGIVNPTQLAKFLGLSSSEEGKTL